jgi:PAS domain S-box-containing protein
MNYFIACYFATGFICAFYYNTWIIAVVAGGIILLAYYGVKMAVPDSNLYQYVLSGALGIFMTQYFYQMHGMFEMQFIAFIGSAILITYQNWKLQIPIAIIVIIHYAVFGYLKNSGFEHPYFTQLNHIETHTFFIHIGLSAIIFFICGLWGYLLKKYSEIQVTQTSEMKRLQTDALLDVKEQAITESDNRLRYAAQATSDAIWDRNYSDDAVFWGEGYRTLFGYEINPKTATAKFWASKVHPEDLDAVTKITREAKDTPGVKTWSVEYRFLKSNGEYAFVREKAIILRDEKGVPYRTIGALQDLTISKRNEIILQALNEQLEKEKYFLDSLMDNMPDSIFFKDRDSKIIRVSKYMADRFGTDRNDLIGKSDFDFQDNLHAKEAFKDEHDIITTGVPKIDYLEKEIRGDQSELWVSTTKMPLINAQGEIVGTFGISRDVTKIKMLEQDRHDALLEKAVAQGKFEIASDVMHDIGNAVVGFGSYLTRIRRLQSEDSPDNLKNLTLFFEKQKTAIAGAIGEAKADALIRMLGSMAQTQKTNQEEINKSITEQLNIITNIQEILNIQRQYITGHESKERNPVDIRNVVNDSLSMLFASLDKMAIGVSLNMATELPIIKGDRTKLMQVLLNVLRNSIEAIDINAPEKNIHLSAFADADKLVLQVKDSGGGFDKVTAGQLFGKGFTTKSAGSGLGLYNCRTIIESHEGTIHISSPGQGKGAVTTLEFKI